jgi:hypothetical protein
MIFERKGKICVENILVTEESGWETTKRNNAKATAVVPLK